MRHLFDIACISSSDKSISDSCSMYISLIDHVGSGIFTSETSASWVLSSWLWRQDRRKCGLILLIATLLTLDNLMVLFGNISKQTHYRYCSCYSIYCKEKWGQAETKKLKNVVWKYRVMFFVYLSTPFYFVCTPRMTDSSSSSSSLNYFFLP